MESLKETKSTKNFFFTN